MEPLLAKVAKALGRMESDWRSVKGTTRLTITVESGSITCMGASKRFGAWAVRVVLAHELSDWPTWALKRPADKNSCIFNCHE